MNAAAAVAEDLAAPRNFAVHGFERAGGRTRDITTVVIAISATAALLKSSESGSAWVHDDAVTSCQRCERALMQALLRRGGPA